MTVALAPDDIVRTHAEAERNSREPLLVLDPLIEFLDANGLDAPEDVGGPDRRRTLERHVQHLSRHRRGCVRRPPRGAAPPSAHDVLREARLLRALERHAGARAKVLAVCDDPAVIGAPFYVMEEVQGEVITDSMPEPLDTPGRARRIADELVDSLVELHAVDWTAVGLEGFGKPSGYLERQLRRFTGLWEHNRTREVPRGRGGGQLAGGRTCPSSPPATIVHGDYRLGNTMFAAGAPGAAGRDPRLGDGDDRRPARRRRLHDDPLDPARRASGGSSTCTASPRCDGFPSREELIERYEQRSGRSMQALNWYVTLALWKAVVFMEGNYKRAVAGSTDDPYLKTFGEGVLELAPPRRAGRPVASETAAPRPAAACSSTGAAS